MFLVLPVELSFAQINKDRQPAFDSIFFHTYINTAATDPDRAMQVADSLYQISFDETSKIRSLMLKSNLHYRNSTMDSTVYYALQAEKMASDAKLYIWQARIYGELSTQHRKYGLFMQGRNFLNRGLEASEKIKDSTISNQFQGHVYQEKGFYAQAAKNPQEAIDFFKTANSYFMGTPESIKRAVFLAQSEERLGKLYTDLKMPDSAWFHYNKALELENMASKEETIVKGFIYNGMGLLALEREAYIEARDFLLRALEVVQNSNLPELKLAVYLALSNYYRAIDDIENVVRYNKKFEEERSAQVRDKQTYASDLIEQADRKLEEAYISKSANILILIIIPAALVLGGMLLYWYNRKAAKPSLLPTDVGVSTKEVPPENSDNQNTRGKNIMSEEVENRILEALNELEKEDFYLKKEVSLSTVATRLNTNARYASYIINKHKENGFNGYINEVRVKKCVEDLKSNPSLWNYKFAYLADVYGFSSHSKFSATFKSHTGSTPSAFILRLKKESVKSQ